MKKTWETPKLISLYRGRPEELVLQPCKTANGPGALGPQEPGQVDCAGGGEPFQCKMLGYT